MRRARGFTLLELVLSLSLLIVLAALAWPLYRNQTWRAELPESASQFRSALLMARSQAVMENRRYRIRFKPGEQQPLIESEVDPIWKPDEFEAVKDLWAREPVLLGDVQVHEVRIGRPIYTKPLALGQNPGELAEDDPDRLEAEAAESAETTEQLRSTEQQQREKKEEELDEHRPTIVFEVDGSTDWATVVLSRVQPGEEIKDEEPQAWVELDGRTGLAKLRDAVTEAQLADASFYIAREKLEPPDGVDFDNLTFNVGGAFAGGGLPGAGGQQPGGGLFPGGSEDPEEQLKKLAAEANAEQVLQGGGPGGQFAQDMIGKFNQGGAGQGPGPGGQFGGGRLNGPGGRFGQGAGAGQGGRFGQDGRFGQGGRPGQHGEDPDNPDRTGPDDQNGENPDADNPQQDDDLAGLSDEDRALFQELEAALAADPNLSDEDRESFRREFLDALRNGG